MIAKPHLKMIPGTGFWCVVFLGETRNFGGQLAFRGACASARAQWRYRQELAEVRRGKIVPLRRSLDR